MVKFIKTHVVVNQFQVHLVINFIQNSLVVLVYQTAFDNNCSGNLVIIFCMLVWWRYNWINRYNILNCH